MNSAKTIITDLAHQAGITINGNQPWDVQVHNENFYQRILHQGELGLGESYMDGWWDCPRIDIMIERLVDADIENKIKKNKYILFKMLLARFVNFQTKQRALQVGELHYDLSNTLFENMLDSRMNYTCGYWKHAANLDEAQEKKLELTCQKLFLKPGMRLLDIGCGFGALAKYAAEKYGVTVVGITISQQQANLAKERCKNLPVDIRFQDYREINETFDRIVSLGMFEHVGPLNYRTYMEIAHRNLTEQGLFLLHTIGRNQNTHTSLEWMTKYIFPNGALPTISQIGTACENLFVMEDWHNFGADYDKTLLAWHANFNQHWENLKSHFDERFFRMWNYYLLYCAGGFRGRDMQLWQIVFSKKGIKGGYHAPR